MTLLNEAEMIYIGDTDVADVYLGDEHVWPSTRLMLWLDASDNASFEFSSGALVSRWIDKSPGGKDVFQADPAVQPVRLAAAQNGLPVVSFPGPLHQMNTAQMWDDTPPDQTVIGVFAEKSYPTPQHIFAAGTGEATLWLENGSKWWTGWNNGGPHTAVADAEFHTFALYFNAPNGWFDVDGVRVLDTNMAVAAKGTPFKVGCGGLGGSTTIGGTQIAELIVVAGEVLPAELTTITDYLREKWFPPVLTANYDASDATTLTVTGNAVSQWRDKGPGGWHLNQATASRQPLTGRTINGVPALEFTSALMLMDTATGFVTPQPLTIFAVAHAEVSDANVRSIVGQGGDNSPDLGVRNGNVYADAVNGIDNTGNQSLEAPADLTPHIFTVEYDGATSKLYVDGTVVDTGDVGPGGWSTSYIRIGSYSGAPSSWDGLIGEIQIYRGVGSTAWRESIEQQLEDKWFPPPIPITGLGVWLDAADDAQFVYSVLRAAPDVTIWKNKGLPYHAQTANPASPPKRDGTLNGLPTVTFDGTTHSFVMDPNAGGGTGSIASQLDEMTVFVVSEWTAGTNNGWPIAIANVISINGIAPAHKCAGANVGILFGGIAWSASTTPTPAGPHLMTLTRSGGTNELFIDGASVFTNTTTPNYLTPVRYTVAANTANDHWGGQIAEIIFYDRALTPAERTQVETYLNTKWGL